MARARSRLNLLAIRSRSVIFSSPWSPLRSPFPSAPSICLSNLPRLLTSDAVTTGSNFSLMNHEAPFAYTSNFEARASQFPLAFSPSSSPFPSRSRSLSGFYFSVLLRYLVRTTRAPLKYNICIADGKSSATFSSFMRLRLSAAF